VAARPHGFHKESRTAGATQDDETKAAREEKA